MILFRMLMLTLFLLSQTLHAQVVGVRIDDVASYLPRQYPLLAERLTDLKRQLPRMLNLGPQQGLEIHNIFFNRVPRSLGQGDLEVDLTVFSRQGGDEFLFTRATIELTRRGFYARSVQTIPLKDTDFRLQVGLIERKLIATDANHQLTMVFPVGVGGFDEGVMIKDQLSLVTPRFQVAWLDKREAYAQRNNPSYFAGQPFLRITNNQELNVGYTAIGLHAQPNLASFIRGFDSNGCIRMQTEDLIAMHRLLAHGSKLHIPIQVLYRITSPLDHPMPKVNTPFKTVKNSGTRQNPAISTDLENGLVEMVRDYQRQPPVSRLRDHEEDQYHRIFNYDTRTPIETRIAIESNMIDVQAPLPGVRVTRPPAPPPVVVTPPRPIPQEPRGPRNMYEARRYCEERYPYFQDGWSWTRERLRRQYNQCMREWSEILDRRPR